LVPICNGCLIGLGDSTNNPRAAIPWGQITAAPREWIKDWDENITIKEPTKMVSTAIDRLYRHLLGREDGLAWIQSAERKKGVGRRGGEGKGKGMQAESDDESDESMGNKGGVKGSKSKGKAREIKIVSDDENGDLEYNGSEGEMKSVDGDEMDIEMGMAKGSSSKRPLGISGSGDAPSSKKRRTKVADKARKPNTRYEASDVDPLPQQLIFEHG
jgi:hypothetical protein